MARKRTAARHKVARTRNGGRWTEAEYFSRLRSAIRRAFSHWEPANKALRLAKVRVETVPPDLRPRGLSRQTQFLYRCAICGDYFQEKQVQRDHIIAAGPLRSLEDLPGFVERLTQESPDAFQVLCHGCHKEKTEDDRRAMRANRAKA